MDVEAQDDGIMGKIVVGLVSGSQDSSRTDIRTDDLARVRFQMVPKVSRLARSSLC